MANTGPISGVMPLIPALTFALARAYEPYQRSRLNARSDPQKRLVEAGHGPELSFFQALVCMKEGGF